MIEKFVIVGWLLLMILVGYKLARMQSLIAKILIEVKKFNERVHSHSL